MSIVVDGHGTSLDYIFRAISYGKIADFLEGNEKARREGEWLATARSGIAYGLWTFRAGDIPKNYDGVRGFDFSDDLWKMTLAREKLGGIVVDSEKLVEDLRRYDWIFIRAGNGEVFSPDHEACKLFREMARKASRKAESITYRRVCGGHTIFD